MMNNKNEKQNNKIFEEKDKHLNTYTTDHCEDTKNALNIYVSYKLGRQIYMTIDKVVAEYRLKATHVFPYGVCKVRVRLSFGETQYFAMPNIGVIDRTNGWYTEDGTVGFGNTIEEALDDLLTNFIELIYQYEKKFGRKLTNEDYCYSDSDDF